MKILDLEHSTLPPNKELECRIAQENNEQTNKLVKEGWRFVEITKGLKIFVPCDKDGNPTQLGLKKIEQRKKILGIA